LVGDLRGQRPDAVIAQETRQNNESEAIVDVPEATKQQEWRS
jgi:hypothetical protein